MCKFKQAAKDFFYPVNDNFEVIIAYLTLALAILYILYLMIWPLVMRHTEPAKPIVVQEASVYMDIGNPVYELPYGKK